MSTEYADLLEQARMALQAGRIDRLVELVAALDGEGSAGATSLAREIRLWAVQRDEPEVDGSWIEPVDSAPHAIAKVHTSKGVVVARKSLARDWIHDDIDERFSSAITSRMLLGYLDGTEVTDSEVRVSFRGLPPAERRALFDDVCRDPWATIEYPWMPRANGDEVVSPLSEWDPTPRRCASLDAGERVLRQHAVQMLAREDLHGKVVYDPACSTGTFLRAIKEMHPGCRTVGQDLHRGMVEHARSRVDEVHLGDAKEPAVEDESVELLLLRFLCWGTVSRAAARKHFQRLTATVRPMGRVILIGHTPVLLAREDMEGLGLEVERRNGFESGTGIFQFYVFRKTGW